MERLNLNLVLIFVHVFLLVFLACNPTASSRKFRIINPLQGSDVCAMVNCGQGTCKASNASVLGFDCDCYPGWKKLAEIGPACVLPDCTIDLRCGDASPPSPPSPALPPRPPPLNISSPCNFVWCGDGICIPNGNAHTCQCNQGSKNFINNSAFACFKPCSFGQDCYGSPVPAPALALIA